MGPRAATEALRWATRSQPCEGDESALHSNVCEVEMKDICMQLFREVRVRIQLLWVLDVESFEALIKDGIGGFD